MRRWLAAILGVCLSLAFVVVALLDVAPALPLVAFALGVVSAAVTGLSLCLLLALRALRLRKRPVTARPLVLPAVVVAASVLGLAAGYLAGPVPVPNQDSDTAGQLGYMYRTDQRDRVTLRWLNTSRDDARIARGELGTVTYYGPMSRRGMTRWSGFVHRWSLVLEE